MQQCFLFLIVLTSHVHFLLYLKGMQVPTQTQDISRSLPLLSFHSEFVSVELCPQIEEDMLEFVELIFFFKFLLFVRNDIERNRSVFVCFVFPSV